MPPGFLRSGILIPARLWRRVAHKSMSVPANWHKGAPLCVQDPLYLLIAIAEHGRKYCHCCQPAPVNPGQSHGSISVFLELCKEIQTWPSSIYAELEPANVPGKDLN